MSEASLLAVLDALRVWGVHGDGSTSLLVELRYRRMMDGREARDTTGADLGIMP